MSGEVSKFCWLRLTSVTYCTSPLIWADDGTRLHNKQPLFCFIFRLDARVTCLNKLPTTVKDARRPATFITQKLSSFSVTCKHPSLKMFLTKRKCMKRDAAKRLLRNVNSFRYIRIPNEAFRANFRSLACIQSALLY